MASRFKLICTHGALSRLCVGTRGYTLCVRWLEGPHVSLLPLDGQSVTQPNIMTKGVKPDLQPKVTKAEGAKHDSQLMTMANRVKPNSAAYVNG